MGPETCGTLHLAVRPMSSVVLRTPHPSPLPARGEGGELCERVRGGEAGPDVYETLYLAVRPMSSVVLRTPHPSPLPARGEGGELCERVRGGEAGPVFTSQIVPRFGAQTWR